MISLSLSFQTNANSTAKSVVEVNSSSIQLQSADRKKGHKYKNSTGTEFICLCLDGNIECIGCWNVFQ